MEQIRNMILGLGKILVLASAFMSGSLIYHWLWPKQITDITVSPFELFGGVVLLEVQIAMFVGYFTGALVVKLFRY